MTKRSLFLILGILSLSAAVFFQADIFLPTAQGPATSFSPTATPKPTPEPTPTPLPAAKTLINDYHIFQTFNNCGPASLSMALSYYGVNKTQAELGQELRPVQNAKGINDDKSVTLHEMTDKASELGFLAIYRPGGNIELLKQLLYNGLPVITRTLLAEDSDIGHYRIIKGYDDIAGELLQDDSLQGHNLKYSYPAFLSLWKKFNYEYLVLVPPDQEKLAKDILGEDYDETVAWNKTVARTTQDLADNPEDVYARLALSIALFHIKDFAQAATEYEKVESRLSFRTLWYQIEPILVYFELGDYDKVLAITEKIFHDQNIAYSELYILRGRIFQARGDLIAAKQEFEKAVLYNKNLPTAQAALASVQ